MEDKYNVFKAAASSFRTTHGEENCGNCHWQKMFEMESGDNWEGEKQYKGGCSIIEVIPTDIDEWICDIWDKRYD